MSMSYVQIKHRRGTSVQWSSANPVLGVAEIGIEVDSVNEDGTVNFPIDSETGKIVSKWKIGDGKSVWSLLPYASGPIGPVGPMPEVFEWASPMQLNVKAQRTYDFSDFLYSGASYNSLGIPVNNLIYSKDILYTVSYGDSQTSMRVYKSKDKGENFEAGPSVTLAANLNATSYNNMIKANGFKIFCPIISASQSFFSDDEGETIQLGSVPSPAISLNYGVSGYGDSYTYNITSGALVANTQDCGRTYSTAALTHSNTWTNVAGGENRRIISSSNDDARMPISFSKGVSFDYVTYSPPEIGRYTPLFGDDEDLFSMNGTNTGGVISANTTMKTYNTAFASTANIGSSIVNLFHSSDFGGSWNPFSFGLPIVPNESPVKFGSVGSRYDTIITYLSLNNSYGLSMYVQKGRIVIPFIISHVHYVGTASTNSVTIAHIYVRYSADHGHTWYTMYVGSIIPTEIGQTARYSSFKITGDGDDVFIAGHYYKANDTNPKMVLFHLKFESILL